MNKLVPIERNNQRVLLTSQLAEIYGAENQVITNNFNRNKDRYTEGRDYFALEGEEKREFLNLTQIDLGSAKNTKTLYLWTEYGALLHAKSLGTDEAWAVYQKLVDTYFRVRDTAGALPKAKVDDPTKLMRANAMLLNAKSRAAKQMTDLWNRANVEPQYQALALNNFYEGLEVPRIAFKNTATAMYDLTTIAKHLGVLSKSGKPHGRAIGSIISKLTLEDGEYAVTPYHNGNHDGVSMQYTESVERKVAEWLIENNYPASIDGNGSHNNVFYREGRT